MQTQAKVGSSQISQTSEIHYAAICITYMSGAAHSKLLSLVAAHLSLALVALAGTTLCLQPQADHSMTRQAAQSTAPKAWYSQSCSNLCATALVTHICGGIAATTNARCMPAPAQVQHASLRRHTVDYVRHCITEQTLPTLLRFIHNKLLLTASGLNRVATDV